MSMIVKLGVISSLICLLSGCMVGPDFHSPRSHASQQATWPLKSAYSGSTVAIPGQPVYRETRTQQQLLLGRDIVGAWWDLFHSPLLNQLIEQGLRHSPTLASAKAALTEAEFNVAAQAGTLFPAVSGNLSAVRNRLSVQPGSNNVSAGTVFNLLNAELNVSYLIDVFGGLRRQLEAAHAAEAAATFELEVAYLTLSADIVTTSITIASLKEQISATEQLIQAAVRQLAIVRERYQLGGDAAVAVFSQETTLAQQQAALPVLKQQLALMQHALAVLVGQAPTTLVAMPLSLQQFVLPRRLPLSLPAQLARQRPDILAAEALLHQRSAQIGVATADLYPNVTLSADYGWSNTALSQLWRSHSRTWSMGPLAVNVPVFQGGTLMALRQAAIARYQQAAAQYQQIVLHAWQNVIDTLRAIQHDEKHWLFSRRAERYARASWRLAREQYQAGGNSYIDVLIAEQTYQQARLAKIKALAARYTDTVALLVALGGGWWHRSALRCHPLLLRNVAAYDPEQFNR